MGVIDRDYEDLRGDGRIVLFLREGKNPKYNVRLKVPNAAGYKFASTKTPDRNEAVRIAMNLYDELYHHVSVGGSIKSNTFADVFKEWKKSRSNAYRKADTNDRSVEYVATYALDYFGKIRIDQISAKEFHTYWDWRKVNFKRKKPTHDTLNRERNAIQSLMKFALHRGYATKPFTIPKLDTKGISRRPTFTLAEWKKITTGMRKWVKEGKSNGHWRERFVLQQYVLLLSNSGIRIGEMRNVTWDDISSMEADTGKLVIIRVNGKTGIREVVCNPGSEVFLRRIYDLRKSQLEDTDPPLHEAIFINPKTSIPITSFKVGFNSMLRYCEIPIAKEGMNRTIYSLRHFYGTQRLRGNINPYILAKNMGTSVEMIEKFYGHILTPDIVSSIKKTSNQSSSKNLKGSYPF